MKEKMRGHRAELIFIATLLTTAIFLIIVNGTFRVDDSSLLVAWPENTWNEGWTEISADGNARPVDRISRSDVLENGGIILENTLPDTLYRHTVFAVRTYSEKVRVSIDGEAIFDYGWNDDTPFGNGFGNVLQLVNIPLDAAGKTLRLELVPKAEFTAAGDYDFHLCSRGTMVFVLLADNLFLIANSILVLLAAILLVAIGLLMIRRGTPQGAARLFLGLFILIEQIWAFADSLLLQLFFGNKAFLYMLNYAAFILALAPLALCVASLLPQYRRRYHAYALLSCLDLAVSFGIYSLGWADLYQLLPITYVLMSVAGIDALICCVRSRKDHPVRLVMLGIAVCIACALISLGTFFFTGAARHHSMFNYNIIMSIGLDFLIGAVYISLLRMSVSGHHLRARADQLEEEAYQDKMTGLNNRAAYEARVAQLVDNTESDISVFMIDLNNLKIVNDTMGHRAGDMLIRALSDCLKAAFDGDGEIYRYGGDEFVVICPGCDAKKAVLLHAKLRSELESTRKRGQCLIDVAIGYAVRDAENHPGLPFMFLLKLADSDMYEVKRREKAANLRYTDERERFWMSRIDPNTGLMTFPAFRQRLQSHLYDFPMQKWAILNFDIAGFNSYNTRFGWDAGDRLLKKVADLTLHLCCQDGFCAHGEADNFWMLVNYDDPEEVLKGIEQGKTQFKALIGDFELHLRLGVYPIEDINMHVGEMCSLANTSRRSSSNC